MDNSLNVAKEVLDSTKCIYDYLQYLIKKGRLDVHELSGILMSLDDIWEIVKDKF